MVRPENLRLSPVTDTGRPRGRVLQSNYLGFATEYLVEGSFGLMRASELRRRGTTPLPEGAAVCIEWHGDEALVYRDDADAPPAT